MKVITNIIRWIGVSVFGGMIAVAFLGSILVPAFFVATNVMKEKFAEKIVKNS